MLFEYKLSYYRISSNYSWRPAPFSPITNLIFVYNEKFFQCLFTHPTRHFSLPEATMKDDNEIGIRNANTLRSTILLCILLLKKKLWF